MGVSSAGVASGTHAVAAAAACGGGAVAQHHTYIHGFETELCETREKWQTCGEREARLCISQAGCACKKNYENS